MTASGRKSGGKSSEGGMILQGIHYLQEMSEQTVQQLAANVNRLNTLQLGVESVEQRFPTISKFILPFFGDNSDDVLVDYEDGVLTKDQILSRLPSSLQCGETDSKSVKRRMRSNSLTGIEKITPASSLEHSRRGSADGGVCGKRAKTCFRNNHKPAQRRRRRRMSVDDVADLATNAKLVTHHELSGLPSSSAGSIADDGKVLEYPLNPITSDTDEMVEDPSSNPNSSDDGPLPGWHQFQWIPLMTPSICNFCQQFIWGSRKCALQCKDCKFYVHEKCRSLLPPICSADVGAHSLSTTDAESEDSDHGMMADTPRGRHLDPPAKTNATKTPSPPRINSLSKRPKRIRHKHHVFVLTMFFGPTMCGVCLRTLSIMARLAWKCRGCGLATHGKCLRIIVEVCSKAMDPVLNPTHSHARYTTSMYAGGVLPVSAQPSTVAMPAPKLSPPSGKEEKAGSAKRSSILSLNSNAGKHASTVVVQAEDLQDDLCYRQSRELPISANLGGSSSFEVVRCPIVPIRNGNFLVVEDLVIEEEGILGSGQFGVVRRGYYRATHERVAVKCIDKRKLFPLGSRALSGRHKPTVADGMAKVLHRELSIMRNCGHPGIIRLHHAIETDSMLYLVMDLVEGGDLLQFIMEQGKLSEDTAKFFFHQICVGVQYLHQKGIVHRDLKPENFLLCREDGVYRVKITDFGFATIKSVGAKLLSIIGTPSYMAPEIVDPRVKCNGYDQSADIWSLGVILYACLGGVFPFDSTKPVVDQITAGEFCFPDENFSDVSDLALDLCCRLLVVNPKDRLTIDQCLQHPWMCVSSPLSI